MHKQTYPIVASCILTIALIGSASAETIDRFIQNDFQFGNKVSGTLTDILTYKNHAILAPTQHPDALYRRLSLWVSGTELTHWQPSKSPTVVALIDAQREVESKTPLLAAVPPTERLARAAFASAPATVNPREPILEEVTAIKDPAPAAPVASVAIAEEAVQPTKETEPKPITAIDTEEQSESSASSSTSSFSAPRPTLTTTTTATPNVPLRRDTIPVRPADAPSPQPAPAPTVATPVPVPIATVAEAAPTPAPAPDTTAPPTRLSATTQVSSGVPLRRPATPEPTERAWPVAAPAPTEAAVASTSHSSSSLSSTSAATQAPATTPVTEDVEAEDIPVSNPIAYQSQHVVEVAYPSVRYQPEGFNHLGKLRLLEEETEERSYYHWTTEQPGVQEYGIVTRVIIPEDFAGWQQNAIVVHVRTSSTNSDASRVSISAVDTTGKNVAKIEKLSSRQDHVWTTHNINLNGGSFTPGEELTLHFIVSSAAGEYVDLSTIELNYNATEE